MLHNSVKLQDQVTLNADHMTNDSSISVLSSYFTPLLALEWLPVVAKLFAV